MRIQMLLERGRQLPMRFALPVAAIGGMLFGAWLFAPAGALGPGGSAAGSAEAVGAQAAAWTCSMHPQIRLDAAGKCPICGMDLIPVAGGGAGGAQAGASNRSHAVALSPAAAQRAQIRTTAVVRLGTGGIERRLLGRVDYDETTLRTVTAWTGGRIDKLLVRVTGEAVRRGQVIAHLYSPELHSAQQDLIQAREQQSRLLKATSGAQSAGRAALAAARDRLRLLGVPASEIATMERAREPADNVPIRSPFAGTVIERLATEGNYVTTGAGLYRIANLSRLWVQLDAYESDMPLLRVGQRVSLTVEALPGERFEGRVTFVDPVLNRRTRTARVRIEVDNPNGHLRPGMFAEATVVSAPSSAADAPAPLVIPKSAALFTGRRSLVYVAVPTASRPTYEPRVVRLGAVMGDVYPVLGGLAEGERVVTHGAFVLDADLQIRGGAAMMARPDDRSRSTVDEVVTVPGEHRTGLAAVLQHYLAMHQALASDDLKAAKAAAAKLRAASQALRPAGGNQFHDAWTPMARHIGAHAGHAADAPDMGALRLTFRDLSHHMATILRVFGNPTTQPLRLASCPMALDGAGAEWVQASENVENPYFGASMHGCGEVHNTVDHGTYLPRDASGSGNGGGGHDHKHDHEREHGHSHEGHKHP